MTVYANKQGDVVLLMARAVGEGGMVGDLVHEVRPGESAFGRTYEEWVRLSPGAVEVS